MIRLNGRDLGIYPELGSIETEKRCMDRYTLLSEDLPILMSKIDYCASGSKAYCTDTGKTYVFDASTKTWSEDTGGGGGSSGKEEQSKSLTIASNGSYTVEPDEGKTLSSVQITANVISSGGNLYAWVNTTFSPVRVYTFTEVPSVNDYAVYGESETDTTVAKEFKTTAITSVSGSTITLDSLSRSFTRDSDYDIVL